MVQQGSIGIFVLVLTKGFPPPRFPKAVRHDPKLISRSLLVSGSLVRAAPWRLATIKQCRRE